MADLYVVVHLGSTADDSRAHREPELLTLSWCTVAASSLTALPPQTLAVKPTSTVANACLTRYNVMWDTVKNGLAFHDAIAEFDRRLRAECAGSDFSFVSVDLSMLRVSLAREARDKGVVLPPYLQHPRVFDLRSEYLKWQASHPEALSYPNTSLSNMIAALGAETPAGWDEHAPEHVPKVVETYAAILVLLAHKSVPFEAHQLVLTKPYDFAQDACAFLAERSKILFLANIPAGTTQSELELWFAQHGSRPVAFWALKSTDAKLKNASLPPAARLRGICGFAVFAKHEDAAEALHFNGRLFGDRTAGVLASSIHILDRASELLAPFALLKNRPRPGDWNCPSCGFSNFQRRIACFRCSFPAASAVTIQEQIYSSLDELRCHKPDEKLPLPANTAFYANSSRNVLKGAATTYNSYGHTYTPLHTAGNVLRLHYTNSVPFRAGDWKCTNDACNYHNFAKNLCCLKCGGAKLMSLGSHVPSNQSHHPAPGQASIHSLNSTAAAIAAATASGQALNLGGAYDAPRPQTSCLSVPTLHPVQGQTLQSGGNGLYGNLSQLQQLQYKQQLKHTYAGHLSQHLALLQGGTKSRQKPVLANISPYLYVHAREGLGDGSGICALNSLMNSLSLNNSS